MRINHGPQGGKGGAMVLRVMGRQAGAAALRRGRGGRAAEEQRT